MFRLSTGFMTAAAIGSAFTFTTAANAGCGCGGATAVYAEPQVSYVQPAPTVVQVQPAPIVVQVGQPQVIVQQAPAYETTVPTYVVNQGPVYSGPGTDYSVPYYRPAAPISAYPYIGGYRWRSNFYRSGYRPRVYGNWRYHRNVSFYRAHPMMGPKKAYHH
jgi:hypothetical protein